MHDIYNAISTTYYTNYERNRFIREFAPFFWGAKQSSGGPQFSAQFLRSRTIDRPRLLSWTTTTAASSIIVFIHLPRFPQAGYAHWSESRPGINSTCVRYVESLSLSQLAWWPCPMVVLISGLSEAAFAIGRHARSPWVRKVRSAGVRSYEHARAFMSIPRAYVDPSHAGGN